MRIEPPSDLPLNHLWICMALGDTAPHLKFVQPLSRPYLRQITFGKSDECLLWHSDVALPDRFVLFEVNRKAKKEHNTAFLYFTEGMEGILQQRGSLEEPRTLLELKRRRIAQKQGDGSWFHKLPTSSQGVIKIGEITIVFAITDG